MTKRMLLALAVAVLALIAMGCKDNTSITTTAVPDPVDMIINSSTKSTHTTYWHIYLGSTTGTSDWSFFADGTGTFRQSFLAPNGLDFTWTKLGDDAMLMNIGVSTFKNFSEIRGSISDGTFTVVLDGNPTRRTFVLTAGSLP